MIRQQVRHGQRSDKDNVAQRIEEIAHLMTMVYASRAHRTSACRINSPISCNRHPQIQFAHKRHALLLEDPSSFRHPPFAILMIEEGARAARRRMNTDEIFVTPDYMFSQRRKSACFFEARENRDEAPATPPQPTTRSSCASDNACLLIVR